MRMFENSKVDVFQTKVQIKCFQVYISALSLFLTKLNVRATEALRNVMGYFVQLFLNKTDG